MRLTTIWTIPAMTLRERLHRTGQLWWFYTLPRFLPKRLRYGVLITEGARYSTQVNPHAIVPEMAFMDVLASAGQDVDS